MIDASIRRRGALPYIVLALFATASAAQDAADAVDLVEFANGFDRPLAIRAPDDGSGRLFVVEQGGAVHILRDGVRDPQPFLVFDCSDPQAVSCPPFGFRAPDPSEQGLLGLAFHPEFAQNGRVFVHYSDQRGDTVIARYTLAAGDPDRLDPASATVVLRVDQDFPNHNGGDIHFGPLDGYLYVALGDGGAGGDPCERARTLAPADLLAAGSCAPDQGFADAGPGADPDSRALLGKLLRLDVDATTPATGAAALCGLPTGETVAYAIPPGNPFAGPGDAGCDEIWFHGLRNPFRFGFDRLTGDVFLGDVGQNRIEEIDWRRADLPVLAGIGVDFGWDLCEGDEAFNEADFDAPIPGGCPVPDSPQTPRPIASYDHGQGASVTGGFRYRGAIDAFRGTYVYADFISGRIWFAQQDGGGAWSSAPWHDTSFNIASFGEDEAGELYLTEYGGRVLRFVERPLFRDGFEPP